MPEERNLAAPGVPAVSRRLTLAEVQPAADEIERALGYPAGRATAAVMGAAQELLRTTADVWAIAGGYVVHPRVAVDAQAGRVQVQGLTFETGRIVAGPLAQAESLAVFVCTAGEGIERLARERLAAGDPLGGFVADALGSLIVEKAMDRVEQSLACECAARGLKITARYSPGYCGWSVAEQHALFRLLPPGFCGVRLSESALMCPLKSVSGFIGVGPGVQRQAYGCQICELEACLYRRLKSNPDDAHAGADRSPR